MGFINKKSTSKEEKIAHTNWMGGNSFDITNPILRLRIAASSCFFGEPMYYHQDKEDTRTPKPKRLANPPHPAMLEYLGKALGAVSPPEWHSFTPAEILESTIDKAIEFSPEGTLIEAVRLRNEEHIRTTPQVIMVRFANHPSIKGTGKFTRILQNYASNIIKRADEPSIQLAYQLYRFGKPIPNALKRIWREYLQHVNRYELAKYRMESREVKTIDVVNLVHPASEPISELVKGDLKLGEDRETWESLISRMGSTPETWTQAVSVMGHMALLRNLRNFHQHNVDPKLYMSKLLEGVSSGQQLPFRYFSAYLAIKEIASPSTLDTLEECLIKSFDHSPKIKGKVMSLCDNSGSAQGATTSAMGSMTMAMIANLTAVFTGYLADEGYIGVFGNKLEVLPIRKRASVFEQIAKANQLAQHIGEDTENGIWLFWKNALLKKEHWDSVFIYSDMQAGHGQLYGIDPIEYNEFRWMGSRCIDVPKLIQKYRAEVNPNVKVYCVQVAGYIDTIMPDFYKNTFILGGWGEGIFRFAQEMEKLQIPKSQ